MSGFWIGFDHQGLFLQDCECQGWSGNWKDLGIWGLGRSGCQFGVLSFQSVHVHAGLGSVVLEEGALAKWLGSG